MLLTHGTMPPPIYRCIVTQNPSAKRCERGWTAQIVLMRRERRTACCIAHGACCQSSILPSMETVTTCHGINLPDARSAFFAASSRPPQHGTSMRTMVTL